VNGPAVPAAGVVDPRAIAFADIDQDGDLDFTWADDGAPSRLVCNDSDAGNWLEVELVSPHGQAGAFGAWTRISPAGRRTQIGLRESRGSRGLSGQDDPLLHFGLGSHEFVDTVVDFLGGQQVTLDERGGEPTDPDRRLALEPSIRQAGGLG
jgi:hypothetical protein